MPAPIPAPHCMKVKLHWDFNGRPGSNSWDVFYPGVWNATDVNNLLNDLANHFDAQLDGVLATSFQTVEWEGIDLADPLTPAVLHAHSQAGSNGSGILPNNVTLDVYWPVPSRVRGGRSHTFLTGFVESEIDTGDATKWGSSVRAQVLAWAGIHQGQINTTAYGALGATKMGVVHYHRAHTPLSPPQFEQFLSPIVLVGVHSRSRRLAR